MSVHFVLSELSCGSLSEHKIMKKIVGRLDHTLNHFPSGKREKKKREGEQRRVGRCITLGSLAESSKQAGHMVENL